MLGQDALETAKTNLEFELKDQIRQSKFYDDNPALAEVLKKISDGMFFLVNTAAPFIDSPDRFDALLEAIGAVVRSVEDFYEKNPNKFKTQLESVRVEITDRMKPFEYFPGYLK